MRLPLSLERPRAAAAQQYAQSVDAARSTRCSPSPTSTRSTSSSTCTQQDAYSKEIGEDGEPLWAIVPPPTMLLSGPSDDSRRLTPQVLNAGYSFFDDATATDGRDLQGAYVTAVQQIVQHVVGDPAVLPGTRRSTEPVVLELPAPRRLPPDLRRRRPRDRRRRARALRAREHAQRDRRRGRPRRAVEQRPRGVRGPHLHGDLLHPDPAVVGHERERVGSARTGSMAQPRADLEAGRLPGTPMFVTEFGCDQTQTRRARRLDERGELDLQDQYMVSSTAWEFSQASGRGASATRTATSTRRRRTPCRGCSRERWRATSLQIERPSSAGDMIVSTTAPRPPPPGCRTRSRSRRRSSPARSSPADVASRRTVTPLTGRATFVCPVPRTRTSTSSRSPGTPAPVSHVPTPMEPSFVELAPAGALLHRSGATIGLRPSSSTRRRSSTLRRDPRAHGARGGPRRREGRPRRDVRDRRGDGVAASSVHRARRGDRLQRRHARGGARPRGGGRRERRGGARPAGTCSP